MEKLKSNLNNKLLNKIKYKSYKNYLYLIYIFSPSYLLVSSYITLLLSSIVSRSSSLLVNSNYLYIKLGTTPF